MAIKVAMPQLGESVVEGTVGKWLVNEGDAVEKDQPLVEILTDKADSEIPAPSAGVVVKLLASVDETVSVGDALCEIDETRKASAQPSTQDGSSLSDTSPNRGPSPDRGASPNPSAPSNGSSDPISSPSVRKLAREHGVDLNTVVGSGQGGRITQQDVLASAGSPNSADAQTPVPVSATRSPATPPPAPPAAPTTGRSQTGGLGAFRMPPYRPQEGDEVVPFSRRRRIIADHMVFSKHTAPDVVTFAECDLHRTAKLRDAHKAQYKKEGVNLTYLAFAAAATARALREFPELNARVLDDAYVKLREIRLGIAVDTPQGLVVPVLRNADELTVRGLARSISDVAARARDGNLTPDDLAGKTFTISNPGRQGNLVGGAIISQPNVGILRLGTIKKRVVVVEHGGEDLMAIHPLMHMALTYDHRVVDGVHANGFLYRISEILEQGDFKL